MVDDHELIMRQI